MPKRIARTLTASLLAMLALAQPAAANDNGNGNAGGSGNGNGSGASAAGRITICHATGSTSKPYVEVTVSENGLNGHGDHADDLVPAPAGGCPRPAVTPPGSGGEGDNSEGGEGGTVPPVPVPRCTTSSPVLLVAEGMFGVRLASCRGTSVKLYGDPWVRTWSGFQPQDPFTIGFGTHTVDLGNGSSVTWSTDARLRNVVRQMTVRTPRGTATVMPYAFGNRTTRRAAIVALTDAQVQQFGETLTLCRGRLFEPILCQPAPATA